MGSVRPPAALDGVRVVDLGDELAAYAGRLLADLGAEVIRVEPPGGATTRTAEPLIGWPEGGVSAFERFVSAGKRSLVIDTAQPEGVDELRDLLATADLVIESPGPVLAQLGIDDVELRRLHPGIGHVVVTPFGLEHPAPWTDTDDLVLMAAGGLLHLGGYPDLGPVAAYGGLSRFAASIFGAVAALAALLDAEGGGGGSSYDVSAQECVAQALEDSAVTYALTGTVRERQGDRPREAGSGVYPCRDGYVSMIAGRLGTARAWSNLVGWMVECGSPDATELLDPRWSSFEYRQSDEAIDRFGQLFAAFTAQRGKQDLYRDAQARMIALSPVATVGDVLADVQLASRDFFVDVADARVGSIRFPRAPYRLSATPAADPRPAPALGEADPELFGARVEEGVR
ncbi:CoA transferase [Protaetiibacter mangrovi]|uniref:CoA transferase n=1 Tax=Protaetiibacter mangrovi TaxID=2970926 RepID=A0ABT1ZGJ3_9MICO|nr:CoA transferase [Protaetiibacter mangrovi]MCS0499819.1 CoA transferase [Protaetiibacter mangrovi]TPX02705.1 CoA transferase [Schumannella luteola]